jgi:hypothetical protein
MNNAGQVVKRDASQGCVGLAGKLLGHNFEVISDDTQRIVHPPQDLIRQVLEAKVGLHTSSVIDSIGYACTEITRTHVHCVCLRCGALVLRSTGEK